MKEDKKLDEAKLGHEKPQYEKPVVIDLGELPEVNGNGPVCSTGSSVAVN
ncbi:MAG: hypothetical protein WCJ75_13445 [Desulfomonile sp.]|jgi:hypothetical protein